MSCPNPKANAKADNDWHCPPCPRNHPPSLQTLDPLSRSAQKLNVIIEADPINASIHFIFSRRPLTNNENQVLSELKLRNFTWVWAKGDVMGYWNGDKQHVDIFEQKVRAHSMTCHAL